jgi:predicted nucleotidyltransferase
MVTLIKDNIKAIQDACKKHHVLSLYLFGSAVNETVFNQQSDIDFLYEIDIENFKNWDTGDYDYIDNLDDLEKGLHRLLGRKIDLIPYKNIHNRYFKENVDSNRQMIYDKH